MFVLGLLVVRDGPLQREAQSDALQRTTHNTTLEVLWTVVPVLILLFIAFGPPMSSFRLLYFADRAPDADDDRKGDRASVVLEPTNTRTTAASSTSTPT